MMRPHPRYTPTDPPFPYTTLFRSVLARDGPFESMAYQTGRDYIVEIVPRAAAPTRAVGAPQSGAGTAADPLEPRYTGKPVTFDFQNIAVRTEIGRAHV